MGCCSSGTPSHTPVDQRFNSDLESDQNLYATYSSKSAVVGGNPAITTEFKSKASTTGDSSAPLGHKLSFALQSKASDEDEEVEEEIELPLAEEWDKLREPTKEAKIFLKRVLTSNAILRSEFERLHSFDSDIDRLVSSMRLKQYRPGKFLFRRGDEFDEFLYVVESGTFTSIDFENAKTLLRRGALVGEIAFISGGKRVNTVLSAKTPKNTVYALRRAEYDTYIERGLYIDKVELFQCLSPKQLKLLKDQITIGAFNPGTSIVKKGSKLHCFFIILNGEVRLAKDSTNKILCPGDYFGEASMLPEGLQPFDATASSEVTVAQIDPNAFNDDNIFGPVKKKLLKGIETRAPAFTTTFANSSAMKKEKSRKKKLKKMKDRRYLQWSLDIADEDSGPGDGSKKIKDPPAGFGGALCGINWQFWGFETPAPKPTRSASEDSDDEDGEEDAQ